MRPIAMRCTQEQFDMIKPKLENVEDISSRFEFNCYLVNNYRGIKHNISNSSNTGDMKLTREIHETWNERIFLEACGIKVDDVFEITKETILKYNMKDEFPSIFDVKLEDGKWYKYCGCGVEWLMCYAGNENNNYGFNTKRLFSNGYVMSTDTK